MNDVAMIILVLILFETLIDFTCQLLNVNALRDDMPADLAGIYDEAGYAASQRYLRAKTTFGMFSDIYQLAFSFLLWFSGWYNWLDVTVARAGAAYIMPEGSEYIELIAGIIFILSITLLQSIYGIPLSIYSTFVLEERFGFNKTTPTLFVVDFFKSMILSILIGTIVLSIVLALFMFSGPSAWLYCWAFISVTVIVLQALVPTVIMPLFNKFESLPDGELQSALTLLMSRLKYELSGVYVMDGSKRSSHSNAFFAGFSRWKRLVLYDSLVEQLTPNEIVAVVGHELGHAKLWHIQRSLVTSLAQMGIICYVISVFTHSRELADAYYMEHVSVYAGLAFFSGLYAPLGYILGILSAYLTRRDEYAADRYSVDNVGTPEDLISALRKLATNNLSNLTPHWLIVAITYSHPPLRQRFAAIREHAKKAK